jgi:hypothetical protein
MSNFYTARRYEQGLAGNKPSIISDKEGYDAQMEGYQAYLRNKDLVDQMEERASESRRTQRDNYDDGSTSSSITKPLSPAQKIAYVCIGLLLIYWDYLFAMYVVTHPHPFPRNIEQPFTISVLPFFLFLFTLVPGCLLLWPGLLLIWTALDDSNKK